MDRELPKEIKLRHQLKTWFIVTSVLIGLIGLIWIIKVATVRSVDWSRIRYSVAEIGTVEATLNASGVIIPEIEQAITAPVSSIIQSTNFHSGDNVSIGQSILELEPDKLQVEQKKISEELELLKLKKTNLESELERKQAEMQASKEVKELEAQFTESQYMRAKRLSDIGAFSEEDLQRAALSAEISRRELSVINLQIDNQRASMNMELQTLGMQISLQKTALDEINRRINLSHAPSPIDGIVTWINDSIGFSVNEGDVIARVADLSSYRLKGEISSVNSSLLRIGQIVRIRIGKKIINGRIGSISPMVNNGISYFYANLDDNKNEALRPNLRIDAFVVTSSVDSVLRVANGPFWDGVHDQTVFIIRGEKALARRVDIGAANFDVVEIKGEVMPGDSVIISDMRKYNEAKVININNREN